MLSVSIRLSAPLALTAHLRTSHTGYARHQPTSELYVQVRRRRRSAMLPRNSCPLLCGTGDNLQDLNTLSGDNGAATWINYANQVNGWADLPGSQKHDAFFWQDERMTDLGTWAAIPAVPRAESTHWDRWWAIPAIVPGGELRPQVAWLSVAGAWARCGPDHALPAIRIRFETLRRVLH